MPVFCSWVANYANDEGVCWPSIATLAADCRCSNRYVSKLLRELEAIGEITAKRRGPLSAIYRINLNDHSSHSASEDLNDGSGDPNNPSPLDLNDRSHRPEQSFTQTVKNRQEARAMERDALKAKMQARMPQAVSQARQHLADQARQAKVPPESPSAELSLRSIGKALGLQTGHRPSIPNSGQTLRASACSASPVGKTSASRSSTSSTTGRALQARAGPRATGKPVGAPGAARLRKGTAHQDLQSLAARDPEACRAAWRTFLPPKLREQMAGIHRSKIGWRTERMQDFVGGAGPLNEGFCGHHQPK